MRIRKKLELSRIYFGYRVVAAAAFSTLAASGFAEAALIYPNTEPGVSMGSIGYIGPVPAQPATVATGNSFDIAVIGYDITNSSSGFAVNDAAYLIGPLVPKVGTTLTDPNATSDGETATVTSSETVSGKNTVDKITFSVPTRFVPVGSTFTDGDVINEEDLEIGFGAGTTGLTFSLPVTTGVAASGTGILNYGGAKHTYTFSVARGSAPYTQLNATDTMLSADEGLDAFADSPTDYTAADLTAYNLSSFSFTFSYTTPVAVPEPGTAAVGLILGLGLLRRRNRNNGSSSLVDLSSGLVDEPMTAADLSEASVSAVANTSGENRSIGEARLV